MVADDPLGLSIAWDLRSDVGFQVDILDALCDRIPQQHLPFGFALEPTAAVFASAYRDHDRPGAIVKQSAQIDGSADVIETQFDELCPLLDEKLVFGNHPLVAGTTKANAYHGGVETSC